MTAYYIKEPVTFADCRLMPCDTQSRAKCLPLLRFKVKQLNQAEVLVCLSFPFQK